MSNKINQKLGLRPAGKRKMMNLPKNRHEASALTSAQCPGCTQRGVIENAVHGRRLRCCTWCGNTWTPEEAHD